MTRRVSEEHPGEAIRITIVGRDERVMLVSDLVDGQPTDGNLHTSVRRERGLLEGSVIGYGAMLDRPQCPEGQCTSMISVPLFENDALTIERVWVDAGRGTERHRLVEIEGPFASAG